VTATEAWRLTRAPFADLSGEGARRYGGRWNSPGTAAVYLSENAALPVLEVLVHLDLRPDLIPADFVLMRVDLSRLIGALQDGVEDVPTLPSSMSDARALGDDWLRAGRTPILRVPSAIIPECRNLILNPGHRSARELGKATIRPFAFDGRLFEFGS